MKDQIKVDKQFLKMVLGKVDELSKRVSALEINSFDVKLTANEFAEMYNSMVEKNLKSLGVNILRQ